MEESAKITFDREKAKKFKRAYNKALLDDKEKFIFEEHEFLTSYAKYLLQYLNSKFI